MFVNATRAASKCVGNALPRLSARRSIPAAAFGLKEYFGWAWGSKMSDNVDTAAPLWDSEVLRVEYAPRQAEPDVGQRIHDDSEIVSFRGSKEPWNVLDEEPRRPKFLRDAGELEEEAAAFPRKSGPLAGDAEVLAGEAAADEINTKSSLNGSWWLCARSVRKGSHVSPSGHVGPVSGKDLSSPGVDFNLPPTFPSCPLQPKVEAAYAREERAEQRGRVQGHGSRPSAAAIIALASPDFTWSGVKRIIGQPALNASNNLSLSLRMPVMLPWAW